MPSQPIFVGYQWRQSFLFDDAVIPPDATFRGEVRKQAGFPVLSTLTTGSGGIVRGETDYEMILVIPPADTATMKPGHVYVDVTRTDGDVEQHLAFQARVTVVAPITAPGD